MHRRCMHQTLKGRQAAALANTGKHQGMVKLTYWEPDCNA